MENVISVVAPVFALIAIGYAAGRLNWISDIGTKGLAEFTFNIAIPALLFRKMATAELPDVTPYALWGAYYGTALAVWLLATLITIVFLRRSAADASSIAMSAGFSNVVMIGMPLSLNLYGEAAAAPVAILVSLHSPLLWAMASVHLALSQRDGKLSILAIGRDIVVELSRNIIILSIIAGTLWRLSGLGFDPLADDIITLIGRAGIPCALISLGLSLLGFRIAGQIPTLSSVLVLKILVMPAIAWVVAFHVFALPPVAAGVVTIFAAMPTGANAYLFASRNNLAPHSASGAVALGTCLSAVTAAVVIYALKIQ
ncbi:MAG: AEC family transporter [Hyphomicrobiaceae bacterium]